MKFLLKYLFLSFVEVFLVIMFYINLAAVDYLFASYSITRYIVLFFMFLFTLLYVYSSFRHAEAVNKEYIKLIDKKGV